jgi:drug/metabolite transporter (DMT)-like permease
VKNATVARFLLQATLWGSSFTFIKESLKGLTPGQLVLARLLLGTAVLLAIAALRRVPLPRGAAVWGHVALAAVFGNVVPFLLLSYGERSTGAGLAGVLVGGTPLLTLGIATAVLPAERPTLRKTLGLLVGFAGTVVVIGPWSSAAGSVGARVACFGAALSYATGYVYVRKFLTPRALAPLAAAASQLLAAAVLQAVALPFMAWHTVHLTGRVTGSILFLGLFSTGLAYVLYFRLIGDVGATNASAVNYVVPVAAVIIGAAALGESVSWNLLVGGVIVLLGMGYAENGLGPLRRAPAPQPAPAPVPVPAPAPAADKSR